jgi:large subunit ribosomal protein L25
VAEYELNVELRNEKGKGSARKMRATGRIPGIYYGVGEASQAISLDPKALDGLIASSGAGMNTLIDLKGGAGLDGKVVLVKEIQRDPVKGTPLHADLYAVNLRKSINVSVPLRLTGSAKGALMGGILDHALREVELSCLPDSIPEEIPVDVSDLDIGDSLHVRDIPLPKGVTLMSDGDLSVVSLYVPAVAEEEPTEEEEEVIGEGVAAEGAEEEASKEPPAEEGADT